MSVLTITIYNANYGTACLRPDWRWRMKTRNGRIIGASTEGYRSRAACFKNLYTVTGFAVASWRRKYDVFSTTHGGAGRAFLDEVRS